jgi:hypothetical protein
VPAEIGQRIACAPQWIVPKLHQRGEKFPVGRGSCDSRKTVFACRRQGWRLGWRLVTEHPFREILRLPTVLRVTNRERRRRAHRCPSGLHRRMPELEVRAAGLRQAMLVNGR